MAFPIDLNGKVKFFLLFSFTENIRSFEGQWDLPPCIVNVNVVYLYIKKQVNLFSFYCPTQLY